MKTDFSADSCQITTSGLAAFKLRIRFAQKFQYGVISFDSSLKMPLIFNFSQLYTLYRFFYLNLKIPITEVTHYSLETVLTYLLENGLFYYRATTWSEALGRRLSNQNDFWKQKIIKCFANGPITFVNLRAVSREVSKFKRHESFQWFHI